MLNWRYIQQALRCLNYRLQHLEDTNPEAVAFNITTAKGTPLIYVCGPQLDGHYFIFN